MGRLIVGVAGRGAEVPGGWGTRVCVDVVRTRSKHADRAGRGDTHVITCAHRTRSAVRGMDTAA
eukprot:3053635-Pyramimonas_sp.AAC.1